MRLMMQNQLHTEYNRTDTGNITHDVTIAWDTLQVNVSSKQNKDKEVIGDLTSILRFRTET